MNWVDLFLAVIALAAIISGWHRGFILGSLDLLSWTASLIVGYIFYPYLANGISKIFTMGVWLLPVAFCVTTIIARILLGFIVRAVIRVIPDHAHDNTFNKLLGVVPGVINGWIAAVIFSALLLSLPLKDGITQEARDSRYAGRLAMQSEWANRKLTPVFGDAVKKTITSLTVNPNSNKEVDLTFTYDRAKPDPALEAGMLELINKERTDRGLKPLKADPELVPVARAQSNDMFTRGYFAHSNPEGKDPFDRMRAANISFRTAGENLALAPTLRIAHTNLMNSPGHRANILNPNYGRVGIGIMDGGYYGLMISQEFRD